MDSKGFFQGHIGDYRYHTACPDRDIQEKGEVLLILWESIFRVERNKPLVLLLKKYFSLRAEMWCQLMQAIQNLL